MMDWVENDCEDQGYSNLSDGCLSCKTQLVKMEYYGKMWWKCPKCKGSYGEVIENEIPA